MIYLVVLLILIGLAREWVFSQERKELLRRIQSPQQVIAEERPRHPRPPLVAQNDDAAYKKLREERTA